MTMQDFEGTRPTNRDNPARLAVRDRKYDILACDYRAHEKRSADSQFKFQDWADAMAAAPQADHIDYDNYHAQRMLERLGE